VSKFAAAGDSEGPPLKNLQPLAGFRRTDPEKEMENGKGKGKGKGR